MGRPRPSGASSILSTSQLVSSVPQMGVDWPLYPVGLRRVEVHLLRTLDHMMTKENEMNEPMIEVPVDDVLERLNHGDNWMQGSWSDGEKECWYQALRQCAPQKGDAFIIEQVGAKFGFGVDFNDNEATTFDTLKQEMVGHRQIWDWELEATFGPNWQQVVAIIRRAATLTDTEAERAAARVAARVAARDAARVAARDAVRVTARDAVWDAVWAAAWDAARVAARDAVWDAVWAVVVQDLIGQHGFTQAHYDTLTGPWVEVIGPIDEITTSKGKQT
ncbi:MAG: hypothetical protein HKN37_16400 [Rhodothermales bacterium]|nr:hypothetical protein [Rhodothermales bacterium]